MDCKRGIEESHNACFGVTGINILRRQMKETYFSKTQTRLWRWQDRRREGGGVLGDFVGLNLCWNLGKCV